MSITDDFFDLSYYLESKGAKDELERLERIWECFGECEKKVMDIEAEITPWRQIKKQIVDEM